MNLIRYSLTPPIKYKAKKGLHDHCVYETKNYRYIVPLDFSGEYINPKNFLALKQSLKIESITIIDKTKPNHHKLCIVNHVNRSGFNFLIGKTPFKNYPRFPDMSSIYGIIPGLETAVVHTVGPRRFNTEMKSGLTISESVGLVAPIWHYVKTKVFSQNFMD